MFTTDVRMTLVNKKLSTCAWYKDHSGVYEKTRGSDGLTEKEEV